VINDFGWFSVLFTWPPFSVWCVLIAITIFVDKSAQPLFSRRVGYFNVWIAVLFAPAGLIIFFKQGVFAFDGLLAFWIPTFVFFGWVLIMTAELIKSINRDGNSLDLGYCAVEVPAAEVGSVR
jgi:hypothetical protein